MLGAGAALASQMPIVLASELGARASSLKSPITIPLWWAPHEIAGAQAAYDTYFTPDSGVTVQFEFIGSDYFPKVFTNLVSGNPYDIITFNSTDTPQFIDRGLLLPLDDLIARDGFDLEDFDSKALEQWTYDGKLYGLSNDMGSFHCYFNLDLFEKAGIKPPSSTDEWTWDQLMEYAEALTVKEGDQIVQYGFAANDVQWCWEMWANLNGATIWNDDFTASKLDDPKVVEAFEFYQNLLWRAGTALRSGTIQVGASDLFIAGQLGILLDGTWQVGYLRSKKDEVKFKWDVGLPPHNASASEYFVPNFTGGWVIPVVAQDPDASWEVLKFYASKTFAEEVAFKAQSSLPTRKSALESGGFYQWPDNPPPGITPEFYGKLIALGKSRQNIGHTMNSAISAGLSKLDLIYSNERAAADVLPEIAAEVTAGLAQ
jgi:multiple sugar transport system substrate-binding protein